MLNGRQGLLAHSCGCCAWMRVSMEYITLKENHQWQLKEAWRPCWNPTVCLAFAVFFFYKNLVCAGEQHPYLGLQWNAFPKCCFPAYKTPPQKLCVCPIVACGGIFSVKVLCVWRWKVGLTLLVWPLFGLSMTTLWKPQGLARKMCQFLCWTPLIWKRALQDILQICWRDCPG